MKVRIKKFNHAKYYMLLSLLIIMIFVRYAVELDIPRIILTSIIILIAILGNQDEIIAIAMCCIPLHEAVDFYYSVAACLGIYVIKNYRRIRINSSTVLIISLIIWELMHCFDADFSLMSFCMVIIPLLFLGIVMCVDVSNVDYGLVVRSMSISLSSVCISLLAKLFFQANFNFSLAFTNLRRLGMIAEDEVVMEGGKINPNSLGIICILVIIGYLQLRANERNKKSDFFFMIVLLVFGTMTASRTFFVCLVLMTILTILAQNGNIQKKVKFLISLSLITIITLVLLNIFFPDLMEYYISRFTVGDITSGRNQIMKDYNTFISNNLKVLIVGIGLNNFVEKVTNIYSVSVNVPHNGIQEMIVAWGLIGCVLFVMLLVVLVTKSRKVCNEQTLLNYIPLIIILTKSMAGQLLTSSYTMLSLAFAYVSLCQLYRQK